MAENQTQDLLTAREAVYQVNNAFTLRCVRGDLNENAPPP